MPKENSDWIESLLFSVKKSSNTILNIWIFVKKVKAAVFNSNTKELEKIKKVLLDTVIGIENVLIVEN